MAVGKLKTHKSPDTDQIPAELIKAGGRVIRCKILNFLIPFRIRRNNLRTGRSLILYLFIRMMINQIVVIIEAYHFYQVFTEFYPTSCCQG